MFTISFDTSTIGHQLLHFPIIDSTNEFVMKKLEDHSLQDGALVWADFQSRGRGQRHNYWESAAGLNLTFSLALFPDLPVYQQFYLNIMASLAITDALKFQLGDSLKIKWPNDIYFDKFKICGILVQNNLKVNKIHSCALGIGLNVNQLHFTDSRATSLKALKGQACDRIALLQDLAITLEERYFQLKAGDLLSMREDYLSMLYRKGEWHQYRDNEGVFSGIISGVEEEGQLQIKREDGTVTYDFKEIIFLD